MAKLKASGGSKGRVAGLQGTRHLCKLLSVPGVEKFVPEFTETGHKRGSAANKLARNALTGSYQAFSGCAPAPKPKSEAPAMPPLEVKVGGQPSEKG
jgi:hypothetical protein